MLVHGNNISQKESSTGKYSDEVSRKLLGEIREQYDSWYHANMELKGPTNTPTPDDEQVISERVLLLNNYKDFVDRQVYAEHFDSRSNLHSTILEEFLYYLFKDLVVAYGSGSLIGKSHAFKDLFFVPPNYGKMLELPYARVETKDHDFVIGTRVSAQLTSGESTKVEEHDFDIPAIAIECKTYLDKTMLEGSAAAATQLKARNPNAIYLVVMEWIKLTDNINLQKYSVIDQLYVLRKQKNTDREFRYSPDYQKNPIYPDVIWNLFNVVRNHLSRDWEGGTEFGLNRGWLL